MANTNDPKQRLEAVDQQIAELEGKVSEGAAPPDAALQLETLQQRRKQLKEQVQAQAQSKGPAKEERASRK